jgi:hypothetical protein
MAVFQTAGLRSESSPWLILLEMEVDKAVYQNNSRFNIPDSRESVFPNPESTQHSKIRLVSFQSPRTIFPNHPARNFSNQRARFFPITAHNLSNSHRA